MKKFFIYFFIFLFICFILPAILTKKDIGASAEITENNDMNNEEVIKEENSAATEPYNYKNYGTINSLNS